MRNARVLVVLFFLATSSTADAATKAIKFGKLIDGTGRVFTNAVVIVDDDRVRSVAAGVSEYGTTPFKVSHHGGVFTSSIVPYKSAERKKLEELNEQLLSALNNPNPTRRIAKT